ncbi:MAG TPA: hypothetical protein VFF08_06560 [Trueperaceae bacterium]|nr:hypothetical protein [Trueperaceae bacterium]
MRKSHVASFLALALAAGSLAAAAPTITLDDSGVDYVGGRWSVSEQDTGYVAVERGEGGLVLMLSQEQLGGGLPAIELLVRDRGSDRRGELRVADSDDIEGVELEGSGTAYTAFTVNHPDVSMRDAVAAWTAALEDLGFAVAAHDYGRATTVSTFSGPDGDLRVVFHATSDGVRVHVAQGA